MSNAQVLASITEAEWLGQVLRIAHRNGFRTYHTHDSRRSEAGFPDLVLARPGRCIFAELKTMKGHLRAEQALWIAALEAAGQTVYVWRPSDEAEVLEVLGEG